jgi:acetyl esterase
VLPAPVRALARATFRLPGPLLQALAGRDEVVVDGQALDRQVQLLLRLEERLQLPALGAGPVDEIRANFRRTSTLLVAAPPRHARRDLEVRGARGALRARLYGPPAGPAGSAGVLPGLVYFHGGGWVVGDLETHDAVCAALAVEAGCRVVAVDYRRAPEHPFPAPHEDAWAAFRDVVARAAELGLDPARVGVAGDSAGGNLAAGVSRVARDAGGPAPRVQALVYASLDQTRDTASTERFASGFLLSRDDIRWYRARCFPRDEDRADLRASPLLAPDLVGLAPAIVVTAGFDPLRDEAHAYAARLREAGVPVVERCERSLVHGFLNLTGAIGAADLAARALARDLRAALTSA